MRIFRNPELKGIFGLLLFALFLGAILLTLTGTFTVWFGWRLPWQKSVVNKIVFVSDRNGHSDIWVMNPDGSEQRPLTNDQSSDSDPVVSPGGYEILFVSSRSSEGSQIYAMDVDGSHVHRLSRVTGSKSHVKYDNKGREITFLCSAELWRMGVNGSNPQRVLPTQIEIQMNRMNGTKSYYTWADRSPDGKLLTGVHMLDDRQEAVWMKAEDDAPKPIVQAMGQNAVPLTGEQVFGDWSGSEPKLVLALTDRSGAGVLATVDVESGEVTPFYKGKAVINPLWSPDGSKIAAVQIKRRNIKDYIPVSLMVFDMGAQKISTIDKGEITDTGWSPDGESIIYSKNGDIYSAQIETGKIKNLTNGKGNNTSPVWTPAAK